MKNFDVIFISLLKSISFVDFNFGSDFVSVNGLFEYSYVSVEFELVVNAIG